MHSVQLVPSIDRMTIAIQCQWRAPAVLLQSQPGSAFCLSPIAAIDEEKDIIAAKFD